MKMRQCYSRQDSVIYQAGLAGEARRVLVLIDKVDYTKIGYMTHSTHSPHRLELLRKSTNSVQMQKNHPDIMETQGDDDYLDCLDHVSGSSRLLPIHP